MPILESFGGPVAGTCRASRPGKRRLRDAGRSRDWVLDRLARTWDAHGGDDERYVAALKEL
jgi:hypothetical protein